jgi:hypothetical protein
MTPDEQIAQQIVTDRRNYVDRVADLNRREHRFNVACQMMSGILANPELTSRSSLGLEYMKRRDDSSDYAYLNSLIKLAFITADAMRTGVDNVET